MKEIFSGINFNGSDLIGTNFTDANLMRICIASGSCPLLVMPTMR
ncbi:pentapeptide repeat-containing protein [Acaryochloris marina]